MEIITASQLIKQLDSNWIVAEVDNAKKSFSLANFKLRLKLDITTEFITNFIDTLSLKNWVTDKLLWAEKNNDEFETTQDLINKIESYAQLDRFEKFNY